MHISTKRYLHPYLFKISQLTVLCYIGMATAMGLNFDIPIVMRSLAMLLFSQNGMKLPIPFDFGFIAMLEVGMNDNQMDKVVHSYAHDWWNDRTRTKIPPYSAMFTTGTMDVCLAHHRKQLGAADVSSPPQYANIIPPLKISTPTTNAHASGASSQSSAGRQSGAGKQSGANRPTAVESCSKCDLYSALAASLYEDLVGIKNFVSTMSVTTNNDVEVTSRRASGFYLLHEKVTLKEMTSDPQHVKGLCGGSRMKLSERAAMLAANELERFKNMPTSHKWMWGETLTREDVLGLWHISRQREHTGYEMSLKPGVLPGEFSATNSPPPSNAKFGSLPDPQSPPPPTTHCYHSNLGSLYRINESSDGESATWLNFEDSPLKQPSSTGADRNGTADEPSKGDVDNRPLDADPMHSGTFQDNVNDIYVSDCEESAAPHDGAAPMSRNIAMSSAQVAADLWLTDIESEEEASDDELDGQSSGTGVPQPDNMPEFKPTPAEVAADLWLSPGVEDVDEESDQEQEDSHEESGEESGEESDGAVALECGDITKSKSAPAQVAGALWLADVDSDEESVSAIPPKSSDSANATYTPAQVAVNLWLESEDGSVEVDDGADDASHSADDEDSNNAGPSWLDEDDVDLGGNSIGGDTHLTGSSLDDDVAVEEVTSITPSRITLPKRTYTRGDFHLPSYYFIDNPEVDMDD